MDVATGGLYAPSPPAIASPLRRDWLVSQAFDRRPEIDVEDVPEPGVAVSMVLPDDELRLSFGPCPEEDAVTPLAYPVGDCSGESTSSTISGVNRTRLWEEIEDELSFALRYELSSLVRLSGGVGLVVLEVPPCAPKA
uniref:Uncharacterized protein n=1 Tax=Anopheles culicifacies TaxID=139723 RepID=A0A182M064_9DIPT